MADRIPFVFGFGVYALVFLNAFGAGVIGLIAGPRRWTQRLCKWNLWATGVFLALLAGSLLCFALTGMYHAAVNPKAILLLVFVLCSPLLLIFLGLILVWFCRVAPVAKQTTLGCRDA